MPFIMPSEIIPIPLPDWDTGSASKDGFKSFSAGDSEAAWWSPNGEFYYILDATALSTFHKTRRFPISTPYDVLTAGAEDQFLYLDPPVVLGNPKPDGMTFSADGKYMYASDKNNPPRLFTWALSTPFDLTTAVPGATVAIRPFGTGSMADIHMSPDGTKFVELVGTAQVLNMWTLSTPFIPAGGTSFTGAFSPGYFVHAFTINAAGTQLATVRSNAGSLAYDVVLYDIPTPWDLTSIGGIASIFDTGGLSDNFPRSVDFSPDNTKLHVLGGQARRGHQWSL